MILRLIFNKYTFFIIAAVVGDQHVKQTYEEATFTKEERTKMENPNYTPTKEEQQAIAAKKDLQKKLT